MPDIPPTPRTKLKRRPDRASYDRQAIYAIIDEAFCASVAASIDGQPHVQPMLHARMGDDLILHGASKNRLLNHFRGGGAACVNITIMDGLVLGATIPDHTMNYRSVTIYGNTVEVADLNDKAAAMNAVFSSLAPARWDDLPPVDAAYLEKATLVLKLPLAEAVAKINESAPAPDANERENWTGVLPLRWTWGAPETRPVNDLSPPAVPETLAAYRRPFPARS